MYLDFFGLDRKPFENTPDAAFLYPSGIHREVLASLIYGVYEGKGFMLVGGDVGTGKTLLLHALAQKLDPEDIVLHIVTPRISADDVLNYLCERLALSRDAYDSSVKLYDALRGALEQLRRDGRKTVLIIDEAHSLPSDTLEEIRLLSNLETSEHKLLQMILAGQSELFEMLNTPELRQLKQRINMSRALRSLSSEETMEYIQHRLSVAGADKPLFTEEAMLAVYEASDGLPRLINQICDNALLLAFAQQVNQVSKALVREAQQDRAMQTESRPVIRPMRGLPSLLPSFSMRQWRQQMGQWFTGYPRYSMPGVLGMLAGVCVVVPGVLAGIGMLKAESQPPAAETSAEAEIPDNLRAIAQQRKQEREVVLRQQIASLQAEIAAEARARELANTPRPALRPVQHPAVPAASSIVAANPKPPEAHVAKAATAETSPAQNSPAQPQTSTAMTPLETVLAPVSVKPEASPVAPPPTTQASAPREHTHIASNASAPSSVPPATAEAPAIAVSVLESPLPESSSATSAPEKPAQNVPLANPAAVSSSPQESEALTAIAELEQSHFQYSPEASLTASTAEAASATPPLASPVAEPSLPVPVLRQGVASAEAIPQPVAREHVASPTSRPASVKTAGQEAVDNPSVDKRIVARSTPPVPHMRPQAQPQNPAKPVALANAGVGRAPAQASTASQTTTRPAESPRRAALPSVAEVVSAVAPAAGTPKTPVVPALHAGARSMSLPASRSTAAGMEAKQASAANATAQLRAQVLADTTPYGITEKPVDAAGRKIVTADFLPLPSERSRDSREALTVRMQDGVILPRLLVQFYGTSSDTLQDLVAAANPERVAGRRLEPGNQPVNLPRLTLQDRVLRSPRGEYYVFYRSFRHQATADAYLRTFANQRVPARILLRESAGGPFYRLFLGPYSEMTQAQAMLTRQSFQEYLPKR